MAIVQVKLTLALGQSGDQGVSRWVGERALQILKGKASDVAAGMRRSATLRQLCPEERKVVDTCADYLLKYRDILRYDAYLAQGLPIATGIIEGACRHLAKDWMDYYRCTLAPDQCRGGIEASSTHCTPAAILRSYWEFHKAQELKRNHSSGIENCPLQKAA